MTKKTYLIAVVVLVLIGGVVFWGVKRAEKANAPAVEGASDVKTADIIYFYGETCSHCKEVSTFLDANKIADKVTFVKREVWHNSGNATEMQNKATQCGIAPSGMGVPFVFGNGKCYVGTPDVEAFFKQAAGLQ